MYLQLRKCTGAQLRNIELTIFPDQVIWRCSGPVKSLYRTGCFYFFFKHISRDVAQKMSGDSPPKCEIFSTKRYPNFESDLFSTWFYLKVTLSQSELKIHFWQNCGLVEKGCFAAFSSNPEQ